MTRIVAAAVLVVGVSTPALAHTPEEQEAWKDAWIEKVQEVGITPRLLAEYRGFLDRHVVPPAPTPRTSAVYRGIGSGVERWRDLVSVYFDEVDRALCIMSHESGGNPDARNPSSGAAGLFQVMPFWWDHYGGDRYDAETNVRVASKILAQQGWTAWSPYLRGNCR